MATQDVPPPPRKEDQKFDHWLYQFWKRVGVTAAGLVASSPITIGTGAGTYTFGHGTSGVVSGTYGGSSSIPQIVVNTFGHVTAVSTFALTTSGGGELSNFITGGTTTMGTFASRVYASVLTLDTSGGLVVPSTSYVTIAG